MSNNMFEGVRNIVNGYRGGYKCRLIRIIFYSRVDFLIEVKVGRNIFKITNEYRVVENEPVKIIAGEIYMELKEMGYVK